MKKKIMMMGTGYFDWEVSGRFWRGCANDL